jgi:hypothetical protein
MQRAVWSELAPFLREPVLVGLFIAFTAAVEGPRSMWKAMRFRAEYGSTLRTAIDTNLALLPATFLAARILPPAAAAAAHRATAIAWVYAVSTTSHASRRETNSLLSRMSSSPVPLATAPEPRSALK